VCPSRDDGGGLVAEPADEEQILSSGEVLVDGGVLAGQSDQEPDRCRVGHYVVTEDRGPSRVRFDNRAEDAHDGCFAGTVGSEHTQRAARRDSQVDPVQRNYRAVVLGQPFSADHLVGPLAALARGHGSRPELGLEANMKLAMASPLWWLAV